MKAFYFILKNEPSPEGTQIITDFDEKKRNIIDAIQTKERIEIAIPGSRIVVASSVLLKIVKKNSVYYMVMDSLIPSSANNALLEIKKLLISYKIKNIECGFIADVLTFQKSLNAFIIEFPQKIYRLQRRMYFRISTTMMNLIKIAFEIEGASITLPVVDVSEGGLSFFSKTSDIFTQGELYKVSLLMPDGAVLPALVKMCSIYKVVHKRYRYRAGVEFRTIDKRSREIIARYVFSRQMEEIQKSKRDDL